jgi:hypothetical protein
MTDRTYALNSIAAIHDRSPEIIKVVQALYERRKSAMQGFARYSQYDALMSEWLLKKWTILVSDTGQN